ncbi:VOC family protein [Mycobacterium sp. M1]|uniref:VOC family protein n=1 Tax=Mycolicibacter acidiphilus TaxID=2835306 RepID=A0ABS5RM30_9MYCO|nr:VOC family protein [Mycolicibacter acidiphilus]MBS9535367.1 VOC family protein [Mycolicibacter acidiphilus]
MSIAFNHTIVAARDKRASAAFLAELFGLPDPAPVSHFQVVALSNGVSLDYDDVPSGEPIQPRHYAFLVSENDFDAIYAKITARGLEHWADPRHQHPGEVNHREGGRGVYFRDPAGHNMEILTRA